MLLALLALWLTIEALGFLLIHAAALVLLLMGWRPEPASPRPAPVPAAAPVASQPKPAASAKPQRATRTRKARTVEAIA
jgi:hypothetical protein